MNDTPQSRHDRASDEDNARGHAGRACPGTSALARAIDASPRMAAQRASIAAAFGGTGGREAPPGVHSPTAGSAAVTGVWNHEHDTVQLLRMNPGNHVVAPATLTDEVLYQLAGALAENGTATAFGPYRFDAGDFDAIRSELAARQDAMPTMQDYLADVGVGVTADGTAMDEEEDTDPDHVHTATDEMIAHLTTEARFAQGLDRIKTDSSGQERELRDWPERLLIGAMGEYGAQSAMAAGGQSVLALNSVALNFNGLDHLSNDPTHPFEQTKLHVSNTTANVDTYLRHAGNAGPYAIKAVRSLAKHKAKIQLAITTGALVATPLVTNLLAALGDLDGTSDDDIDGSAAHQLVRDGMAFSVPADIYAQISAHERGPFRPLAWTVAQFNAVRTQMAEDFDVAKPYGSKSNEDEDYTG